MKGMVIMQKFMKKMMSTTPSITGIIIRILFPMYFNMAEVNTPFLLYKIIKISGSFGMSPKKFRRICITNVQIILKLKLIPCLYRFIIQFLILVQLLIVLVLRELGNSLESQEPILSMMYRQSIVYS